MIKVLMLGWEFPPSISGGLGVACEGLTKALIATKDVRILFIVPKAIPAAGEANHESRGKGLDLIGANNIDVPTFVNESFEISESETKAGTTSVAKELLTIERVDAVLKAYETPTENYTQEFIENWTKLTSDPTEYIRKIKKENKRHVGSTRYDFEGGYGNNLFREVDYYTHVVTKLALDNDFDVIHAHDWMTFPAAIAVKHATGKPLVIHVHATEFDRAGATGSNIVYDIERAAVESSDRIVAVSRFTKNMLVRKYRAPYEKIDVVYNGIDPTTTPPIKASSHALGEHLVTFVGRITFQKGPEYFVDAAEKVLREFPDCHFVMAGSGDALPNMIKRVISKKMSGRFHFTGFMSRSDVMKLLSYTRVYVMPSVSEPFGLTAMEAVTAGVPTVISKQAGVAEVMPDVIKADFWDTDALAHAICGILRYPTLAETMRQNAMGKVGGISWNAAAKDMLDIYQQMVTRDELHSPSIH